MAIINKISKENILMIIPVLLSNGMVYHIHRAFVCACHKSAGRMTAADAIFNYVLLLGLIAFVHGPKPFWWIFLFLLPWFGLFITNYLVAQRDVCWALWCTFEGS